MAEDRKRNIRGKVRDNSAVSESGLALLKKRKEMV